MMDLAIRVNVRYAAPPNSQIKDALRLFKSPRWVQSIIRYIIPQLNSVSPVADSVLEFIKNNQVEPRLNSCCQKQVLIDSKGGSASECGADCGAQCVICMESMDSKCLELPCKHQYHEQCIETWLKMHSTCPTCRAQLPTDSCTNYSVYAINTTIILQQSQASLPTEELLELSASNQVIRAVVNARVRRSAPGSSNVAMEAGVPEQPSGNDVMHSLVEVPTNSPRTVSTIPSSTEVTLPQYSEIFSSAASVTAGDLALLPAVSNSTAGGAETHEWTIIEPIVPIFSRHALRRRYRQEDEMTPFHKRRRMDEEEAVTL